MYDVPEEYLRKPLIKKPQSERKAIIPPPEYGMKLERTATNLGLPSYIVNYCPLGAEQSRTYFVFSTDLALVNSIRNGNEEAFKQVLDHQKENDNGVILLDSVAYDISDLTEKEVFATHQRISYHMQYAAVCKMAFESCGYPVPRMVSLYTARSIYELDQMRSSKDVPLNLRDRYDDTYHRAMAEYSVMYNSDKVDKFDRIPKQRVNKEYFEKNHIPITWEVVWDSSWKDMKRELHKHPDFIYYKAPTAHITLKNLNKRFERIVKGSSNNYPNFWKDDTGGRQYLIAFPTSRQGDYYSMLNESNYKDYDREPLEKFLKENHSIETIYVNSYDMSNWNSLCKANGVVWALNDGSYGEEKITGASTSKRIPILYRSEDKGKVQGIVNRLVREMQEYIPVSDKMREEYAHKGCIRTRGENYGR